MRLYFTLLIILTTSCLKQTEKITPLAEPMTLAELQREQYQRLANQAGGARLSTGTSSSIERGADPRVFYFNVRYNIKDIDVFEMADMPNAFEQIGNSFLSIITRVVLSAGPRQIDLDELVFDVPDVAIDRDTVVSVKIRKIFLQFAESVDVGSDFTANFAFIDSLEMSRQTHVPGYGNVDSLLFSYRKKQNKCFNKCLDFEVYTDNLLDLLKPGGQIKFKPTLSIASIPDIIDLKLDGQIEIQVGIRLPF